MVATSLTDGGERWFTYGPAVEAILASAAMPAIFPPVEIDGERYIDGGVVDNVPIQRAIDAGATRIVVLLCSPPMCHPGARPNGRWRACSTPCSSPSTPGSSRDMAQLPAGRRGHPVQWPEGATRDFDDFSTTEHLIALGRAEASEIVRRYGLGRPRPTRRSQARPIDPSELRRRPDQRDAVWHQLADRSAVGRRHVGRLPRPTPEPSGSGQSASEPAARRPSRPRPSPIPNRGRSAGRSWPAPRRCTQWSGKAPRTTAPAATTTFSPSSVPGRITTRGARASSRRPMITGTSLGHWTWTTSSGFS